MSMEFFKIEIKNLVSRLLAGEIVAKVYDSDDQLLIQTFNGCIVLDDKLDVVHIEIQEMPVRMPANQAPLNLMDCIGADQYSLLLDYKAAFDRLNTLGRLLREYQEYGDHAFSLMTPAEAGTLKLWIMETDEKRKEPR